MSEGGGETDKRQRLKRTRTNTQKMLTGKSWRLTATKRVRAMIFATMKRCCGYKYLALLFGRCLLNISRAEEVPNRRAGSLLQSLLWLWLQLLPAATAFLPPSGLNIASHHSSQNGRTNKQGMPSCTFNTYWGIISGAGGTESPNTKPCKNN